MRRLGLTAALSSAVAALVLAPAADGRMTILYDVVEGVDELTDTASTPEALVPDEDGLYQQSIARRGAAFPGPGANPRDGSRFVAKILPKAPRPSENCSNAYLVTPSGVPHSAAAMADLIRDGTGWSAPPGCVESAPPAPRQLGVTTFDPRIVLLDEPAQVRTDLAPTMATNFSGAIAALAAEPAPSDVPHLGLYPATPTMAQQVHSYVRFPQSLVAFPDRWSDLLASLPSLGGVWMELYGYGGDATRSWQEEHYATWTRPFVKDLLARGADLRRIHLLMSASQRNVPADAGRTAGDQWAWARTGAACEVLKNGPGAYRVHRGGEAWAEFGAGFRATFGSGPTAQAPLPPDLAASALGCTPAHRLTPTTSPSVERFAQAVAQFGSGAIEVPFGALRRPSELTVEIDVAAGLPDWLDRGFANRAAATVAASTAGSAPVPVDPDGIARLALPAVDPGAVFTLRGLDGPTLLDAARATDGRMPDPHLSLLCASARIPGEPVGGDCSDAIAPRAGRGWLAADGSFDWLLASTTLVAPDAVITEAASPPPPPPPPAPPVAEAGAPSPGQIAEERSIRARCGGRSATIVGTPGADRLVGTRGRDVIAALAGNDIVLGRGGSDLICLGPGHDRANAGTGRDRVLGQAGRDRIDGGRGADRLDGGSGNDRLQGRAGNDLLLGRGGRDVALGGSGNDRLLAGPGRDRAAGGSGNDRVIGGAGNDRLTGGRGRDRLVGGRGFDRSNGGAGPDRCLSSEVRVLC